METAPAAPSDKSPPDAGFRRHLGLFDATMLVAGAMIGSGIFIVSADISRDVGGAGWLMAVWALAGVMTVLGALSYAELVAMMPRAGGQYVYLREAYGPLWGFLYGWTLFLVIQTGTIAAVAVAFAKFLGVLVPNLGTENVLLRVADLNWRIVIPVPWHEPLVVWELKQFTISAGQLVGTAIIVLLTVINCLGVVAGKWVQNVFTVAKTLALIVLIVVGLTLAADSDVIRSNWQNLWTGIDQTPRFEAARQWAAWSSCLAALMVVGGALVGALFSSDAWNNVTFIAGEIDEPQKNIPRAMALGTGLVIVLYLLANVAYLCALPVDGDPQGSTPIERGIAHAKDDRVGTAVLEIVSPRFGVPAMAVAIMISTFGCVNGLILAGARLYYAMARDGLFFRSVGQLSPRRVPAVGLVLQGVWSTLLIFSGTYGQLLDYVIFAALLFYVLTVGGLFVLRVRDPGAHRPYRTFLYPWLPAAYVLLCTLVMLDLLVVRPLYTWPGLLIVLAGIPVYIIWASRRPAVEK